VKNNLYTCLLGAFAKFRKATIRVVMADPPVRMEQLAHQWMDFLEI